MILNLALWKKQDEVLERPEYVALSNALQGYYSDCNKFPSTLQSLVTKDDCTNWGPVAYAKKKDLLDAWGTELSFTSQGQTFSITSLGKDGQEGGEGFDADISSEEL